jgi:hypothetical protein
MNEVLDRVRKLLALSESPNLHEAALAAARAQALIERHRLHDLLAAERAEEEDPDPIVHAWHEPLAVAKRIRKWKVALAAALADANGCLAYVARRESDEAVILVGRGRDRAAVAALWDELVRRIEWLSATEGPGRSRAWHEAFRVGAVDAIAARLRDRGEARAELDEAALAVVDRAEQAHRDALDRFVERHLSLRSGRGLRVDARAYERGRAAAADLDGGLPPGRLQRSP